MKQIWAPWRMSYLEKVEGLAEEEGCIFCLPGDTAEDLGRLVVYRGVHAYVMLNKFPYANGHLLVIPFRHLGDLVALEDVEALEIHRLLRLGRIALEKAVGAQGYNIGLNLGRDGGAGVLDHLHYHLVPRWRGDNNFLPVLGDVRVIPQTLEDSLDLMRSEFARLSAEFQGP